ncbi:unnamed protein product [Phytomonas sp. Hart1]|nr:unnamed protein product [Phytomonas sp. Hart1]|eukprot:CCW68937.1 unnamed protein product [Phytomonas sp. isolate Hart1]
MPKEELPGLLARLEGRVRRGDSVDELLDKLAEPILDGLTDFIRDLLGLEPRKAKKRVRFDEQPTATPADPPRPAETAKPLDGGEKEQVEYNNATRSEKLFGIAFHNRYLFALD